MLYLNQFFRHVNFFGKMKASLEKHSDQLLLRCSMYIWPRQHNCTASLLLPKLDIGAPMQESSLAIAELQSIFTFVLLKQRIKLYHRILEPRKRAVHFVILNFALREIGYEVVMRMASLEAG